MEISLARKSKEGKGKKITHIKRFLRRWRQFYPFIVTFLRLSIVLETFFLFPAVREKEKERRR